MVYLAAAAEGSQAGPNGRVLEREDPPWFKPMKNHGSITRHGYGSIISLGFDESAQVDAKFVQMPVDCMVRSVKGVKMITGRR
jgi:hypothetical protein